MFRRIGWLEDQYEAAEDALKLEKLALALLADERAGLKKLHWMRCPNCGMELSTVMFEGLQIERCSGCEGGWLSPDALEKLVTRKRRKGAVVRAVLNLFGGVTKDSQPEVTR